MYLCKYLAWHGCSERVQGGWEWTRGCVGDERRGLGARVWRLRGAPPSIRTRPALPGPQAGVTRTYISMTFCSSVRPAPSTAKVQPDRGVVSGFRRDTSATSLRFCLGSPRIWKRV